MKKTDLMSLVWTNLWRMKFRTILTTVGVVIGTGAIVTMVSLGVGLQERVTDEFSALGDLTEITVSPGYDFSSGGFMGGSMEIKYPLDEKALDKLEKIEGVSAAMPKVKASGGELNIKRYSSNVNLVGVDSQKLEEFDFSLEEGNLLGNNNNSVIVGYKVPEFFQEQENTRKTRSTRSSRQGSNANAQVTMTPNSGTQSAERIDVLRKRGEITFSKTDAEGKEEQKTVRVRVVGVLEERGGLNDYDVFASKSIVSEIIDWTNNEKNYLKNNGYDEIVLKVESMDEIDRIQKEIEQMGYLPMSTKQMLEGINKVFLILQAVLGGIGAIALLVASLGITNTMIMSIYERTKEIGVMKVIGATIPDIKKMFLLEAGTIGFVGGLMGVIIGWGLSKIINFFINMYLMSGGGEAQSFLSVPLWLATFAIGFAILVGVVSGLYPASKAAKLSPLEAMRQD